MGNQELIPHLFRTEFGKITNVLCKVMGIEYIEIAEDIAGETFLAALESWPYKGIPPNPVAWLYTVAKNKALNHLQRTRVYGEKVLPGIITETDYDTIVDLNLTEEVITDSQLQMLFAVCHPAIAIEAQVSMALRILCGFSIDEIADAFLTSKETVNKRLFRAKEKFRSAEIKLEFPDEKAIYTRLDAVLTTLYLMFSEGYHSEHNDAILRKDICQEAMRLTYMLLGHDRTNRPDVNALLALMCFQASRFEARLSQSGELILYDEQDESLWDAGLVAKGAYFLKQASTGEKLSKYHLEAGIAYWHTQKADTPEKWENILLLFNHLLAIAYSPIAALNRIYALSKVKGKAAGIAEAEKLNLNHNPYYFALLGELYSGLDNDKAMANYNKALVFSGTRMEKAMIVKKLNRLC